ncbi:MAG TPA: hypothetical protein DCF68_17435 [Cyanothece sp. UBA12306]|nr:hypothetical protein [Cyanothece sp. UBA12306]
MKDSQLIILTSFITALKLHQETLPQETIKQLKEIANNLESKVIELDAIAKTTPTLNDLYNNSFQTLLSRAAQRKMGQNFYPSDEEEDTTINNITEDIRPEVARIAAMLDEIKASQILASDNPPETARQLLNE